MHDWLSSNTLQWKSGFLMLRGNISLNSSTKVIKEITVLKAWDRAIYYASEVLREISVCNLLHHQIGKLSYLMMHPVRDVTLSGSSVLAYDQQPTKYASTKHSSTSFGSGWTITPLSFVLRRYQSIRIIARLWLRIRDWTLKYLALYFAVNNRSYSLPFSN